MANIFKAKTLVGKSGIFSNEVIAPNLVYNTGSQIIYGDKSFYSDTKTLISGNFEIIPDYNLNGDPESFVNILSKNVYVDNEYIYFTDDYNTGTKYIIADLTTTPKIEFYDFSGYGNPGIYLYTKNYNNAVTPVSIYNSSVSLNQGNISIYSGNINLRSGIISWNPYLNQAIPPSSGPLYTTNLYPISPFALKSDTYAFIVASGTGIFKELYANNLVYNTGDQTINGNKTFIDNIEVQGTGIFNSVDLSNISEFQFSGTNINLIDSNVYVSGGWVYISGNPVLTGIDLSSYATKAEVATTGSNLNTKIDSLSGYVNVQDIIFSGQTASTGSLLDTKINSLSGYINNQDIIFSGQIANTGSLLNNKINSLSGNAVLLFGDQTVNGIKTFESDIYFTKLASGLSGIFGINHSIGTLANNAVILGGNRNRIGNSGFSSIVNGCNNTITGLYSFIGNGREHVITNSSSFIGGGLINKIGCSGVIAQGSLDFIGGGLCNTIGGNRAAVIVGGEANCITSSASCECGSFIGGGLCNTICNSFASNILGGCCNVLRSNCSSILGGERNTLNSPVNYSTILGGFLNSVDGNTQTFTNILGGCCNSSSANPAFSTIVNGICQRMQSYHSFIGVGVNNFVSGASFGIGGYHAFIGNGHFNCASMGGSFDFIGNGSRQKIFGIQSCNNSILNGNDNQIGHPNLSFSSKFSSILNGNLNTISGSPAAYPGSCSNTVLYSTIINGTANTITSDYSTILGGRFNNITHNGATIISDGSSRTKNSIGNCTLLIDFCCGTSFGNNTLFDVTPQILNVNTNFSIGTGYNSRVVLANSGSILTGRISLGNPIGFNTSIIQIGAGQVQITGVSTVNVKEYADQYKTAGIYATISLLHTGNNGYIMYGNTAP
jgi:hypothetical protein